MTVEKRVINYVTIIISSLVIVIIGIILICQNVDILIKDVSYPAGLILIIAALVLATSAWLISTKEADRMSSKKIWQGIAISVTPLIILTILFTVWQPFIWKWKFGEPVPGIEIDAQTLATLMAVVVALLSLGVGGFGILTYKIVSDRIENVADKKVMQETRRTVTYLANSLCYSFWNLADSKNISVLKKKFIAQAIQVSKETHDEITPKLEKEDPKNQLIIGALRNNLASYFAHEKQEESLAKGYAKYIKDLSSKFPEEAEGWQQTYNEVLEAFSKKQ